MARKIAEDTGVHLRTIQRLMAGKRPAKADEGRKLSRSMETFRKLAAFCRENRPEDVWRSGH